MTEIQLRDYRRNRRKGIKAKDALAIVRYESKDTLWSYDGTVEVETDNIEGFDIRVKTVIDDSPDSSWIGEFTDESGEFPEVLRRRNAGRFEHKYFVPARTVRETAKDLNKLGYSRAESYRKAVEYAYADMSRLEDLYYGNAWSFIGVIVYVSLNGTVLADDSLFGIESDSSQGFMDETVSTMIEGCLKTAREYAMAHAESEELTLP